MKAERVNLDKLKSEWKLQERGKEYQKTLKLEIKWLFLEYEMSLWLEHREWKEQSSKMRLEM